VYDYDWHIGTDGLPVLDGVNPVEWLNAEQTMRSADTDWFDEGTRAGLQVNHNLSISSGNENGNKYLGLNYYENQGTQIHSYFKRYSLRINSDYKLFDGKLVIGENLSVSNMDYNNQWRTYEMLRMPSIVPVRTLDGGWGGSAVALGMDDYWNPIRQLAMNKGNNNINRTVVGNLFAELQLLQGLNIRTSYGLQYNSGKFRHIDFTWEEGGGRSNPNNGINAGWNEDLTQTWTNTLNYTLQQKKHDLDFILGAELVHFGTEFIRGYRRDLEIEDYDYAYLGSATGNQEVYG